MQYITYDEYVNIGGKLDVAAFDRYSIRAFSRINQRTQGRIKEDSITIEVKHLCRDMIDYLALNDVSKVKLSSASQSMGGVSESESYVVKSASDMDADIENMFSDYLSHELLYRGCL